MASKTATAKKKAPKNKLVIVESPAKAKTIEKYLGKGFVVKASMGHLIDLPKSRIAIDVDNNFVPEYITVRGRAKLLKELQSDAKKSSEVLLASDNDREGEAIAWHLRNSILSKYEVPVHRIVFNEITPQAIKEAIKHPMDIDESKVNAQKARRVLDRLVGYNLSPLLWKKVKNGLSAGRVQSVALRLICEREKEVESFIPEEYWTLDGDFKRGKNEFTAQLVQYRGEKPELPNEAAVQAIMDTLNGKPASVLETKSLDKTIRPKPPFTTDEKGIVRIVHFPNRAVVNTRKPIHFFRIIRRAEISIPSGERERRRVVVSRGLVGERHARLSHAVHPRGGGNEERPRARRIFRRRCAKDAFRRGKAYQRNGKKHGDSHF